MEISQEKMVEKSKPVIMLVIDTLMDPPLKEAINNNRAPALKFFMEKGMYFPDVVTAFPTMSVNVDTTILTGTYCNDHHLPGLVWFNKKENRLINYGSHIRELWKLGLSQSLEDILFNMNENHISNGVKTIHEELEDKGKNSASINTLVYRGNTSHIYRLPKLLTWFTSIQKDRSTMGAKAFTYGSLKRISTSKRYQRLWQKFGFNNSFAVQELTYLLKKDQLPSFSIVYFPELDQSVHKNGRMDVKGIEKVDQHLQDILNVYDSWEEALQDNIWIVLGDNGQAWIDSDRKVALIDLRELLGSYRIMKLSKGVQPKDQIVLAVNERMSYIYTLDKEVLPIHTLIETLQNDKRIDVIAWQEGSLIKITSGEKKGELHFREGGDLYDEYNQKWFIEGDLGLLDIRIDENQIHYGDYPDALARLSSSLKSHEGDFIIVSAKPGYEFIGEGSPTHVGGASHGGLHQQDSLVPMIVTGTDSTPSHLRMINLKEWILSLIQ
ncbi:putative AlkP superfamily pyrophosphatase or phosphodiesterase [Bacillus pakistanensis]|uniref:AlkP superfamily pyrophosphatase or phosphodiesterase n=2 Tax=Rossellomorea pakistanensis TaxID=992288 RepID=A0ABS2NH94_9BACI|nr:putative AlkP superfamily pyrophosphatase or phosphodiesterase [Bacillus pakistanensis]